MVYSAYTSRPALANVSQTVIKHQDPKQLGEERVFNLAYNSASQSIGKGSQGRNSRQELKQRPRRNAPYCLFLNGLLSLLS